MRVAHVITRMIIGGAQENTLLNCLDLANLYQDDVLLITGPSTGPEGDLLRRNGLIDEHNHQIKDHLAGDSIDSSSRGRAGESEMTPRQGGSFSIETLPHLRRNIHPIHDWKASREIRHSLQRFQPDVVHTHSAKGGLLGRKTGWSLKVPAVIHSVHGAPFHDYQSPLARDFFRRCEKWAAGRCHHMICVADAMTDLMVNAGVAPREKFTTVYSGMDVDPFVNANQHRDRVRKQLGIAPDQVVIGKVARLFHLKGHDDLVTAAKEVVAQCPNVVFLLVGDGVLRQPLTERIEALGLQDHFIFTGLVPPAEVPSLIGAMDVLVHTSYREGLARALPQALLAGRPAVSYDIDGAREVVISDETGFLIPPKDTVKLAAALTRLASDSSLREKLGREGQKRFTDQFRHQTMTRRIRSIYQQLLK